jgi:hypothetical protein
MKKVEIVVLGGCHVAGYPFGNQEAFPALLSELLHGTVVQQTPYLKFTNLPAHLPLLTDLQPSHVVLQLGNYEFTASLRSILHQYGYRMAASKTEPAEASPTTKQVTQALSYVESITYSVRVLLLSLLTIVLWLFSTQHRRSFQALNRCIKENPHIAFIFLSPFPTLKPADNALRTLGGWLLHGGLAAQPNQYWVNSHHLLPRNKKLFIDGAHLNQYAHRALACGLAGAILSQIDYM